MNSRLTNLLILLLSLLSISALATNDADDNQVSIPFLVVNGLIIIEAEIDNEKGNYIFDTGAEELILNKEVRSGKTMFSSINGDISTDEVKINLLKIGNLTHSEIKAYSADLGSMESYLNISLQGVIGSSVFMPRKIKIDFIASEIILSSTDDLIIGRDSYVNFEMYDGVPVCSIRIEGKDYLFGFDTGATMHVLDHKNKSTAIILDLLKDTGLDTYVTTGTGDKTVNKIKTLPSFMLGNQIVDDAQFLLQDLSGFNESMEQPIYGVLSLTTLDADNIVIDLEQGRIYF